MTELICSPDNHLFDLFASSFSTFFILLAVVMIVGNMKKPGGFATALAVLSGILAMLILAAWLLGMAIIPIVHMTSC